MAGYQRHREKRNVQAMIDAGVKLYEQKQSDNLYAGRYSNFTPLQHVQPERPRLRVLHSRIVRKQSERNSHLSELFPGVDITDLGAIRNIFYEEARSNVNPDFAGNVFRSMSSTRRGHQLQRAIEAYNTFNPDAFIAFDLEWLGGLNQSFLAPTEFSMASYVGGQLRSYATLLAPDEEAISHLTKIMERVERELPLTADEYRYMRDLMKYSDLAHAGKAGAVFGEMGQLKAQASWVGDLSPYQNLKPFMEHIKRGLENLQAHGRDPKTYLMNVSRQLSDAVASGMSLLSYNGIEADIPVLAHVLRQAGNPELALHLQDTTRHLDYSQLIHGLFPDIETGLIGPARGRPLTPEEVSQFLGLYKQEELARLILGSAEGATCQSKIPGRW